VVVDPQCGVGECALEGRRDPLTGCRSPSTCEPCTSCPGTAPVCGTDYRTWPNACLATARGVEVLHEGGCSPREGLGCGPGDWCGDWNLYCGLQSLRCTLRQACFTDEDCARAQQTLVLCTDGGIAPLSCLSHACVPQCG
jgi:hypothetical protein